MVKYAITTVIFKVPKKFGTPTPHPPTFGTVPQIKSSFSLGAWFIDLKLLERRWISIMKKTTLLVFPLSAGCSWNWWNENIGPGCLVNSEPSTFTFQWELIQVLRDLKQSVRGHFLNFYQGLMQKHGGWFPHRERWFAQFCAFAAKENLSPALKMQMELNSLQGFGKRLNWIGNQSWCSTGQTHSTLVDIWRYSKKT